MDSDFPLVISLYIRFESLSFTNYYSLGGFRTPSFTTDIGSTTYLCFSGWHMTSLGWKRKGLEKKIFVMFTKVFRFFFLCQDVDTTEIDGVFIINTDRVESKLSLNHAQNIWDWANVRNLENCCGFPWKEILLPDGCLWMLVVGKTGQKLIKPGLLSAFIRDQYFVGSQIF